MHGSPDSISVIMNKNGKDKEIVLDHRRLAKFLKSDKGYGGGNIRLLSCKTGSKTGTFAQTGTESKEFTNSKTERRNDHINMNIFFDILLHITLNSLRIIIQQESFSNIYEKFL